PCRISRLPHGAVEERRGRVIGEKMKSSLSISNTTRMLGALLLQAILIGLVVPWESPLPDWAKIAVWVLIIVLPILGYLTLLKQPAVTAAWIEILRAMSAGIASIPFAVARLFSHRTLSIIWRAVRELERVPASRDGWIALGLFPFKTFVILGFPLT